MSTLDVGYERRYTVEDMPDHEGKAELVDGRLELSPPAQWGHALVAHRLIVVLSRLLGDDYLAMTEVGVQLGTRDYRQPDAAVVRRDTDPSVRWLGPTDMVLAVEVVSPGSRRNDRIVKPAQYAKAGIEGFWRIETDPDLTLAAYALDPGAEVYTDLGTWRSGETVTVERPFGVSFDLDDLAR
ncbi:MAG: Uma2 family endonuclease [Aeromicrobium sp.]|uniref:Uma2 family endonuclease n=1 Tax=Aeromicrobium sp. TaxID=1871063 RepID=UPI0039E69870